MNHLRSEMEDLVLEFYNPGPCPLDVRLAVLESKRDYQQMLRSELRVLSGHTHLYGALTCATRDFLNRPDIENQLTFN